MQWSGAVNDDTAQITAPNPCIRSWVMLHFAGRIESMLAASRGGRAVRLVVLLPEERAGAEAVSPAEPVAQANGQSPPPALPRARESEPPDALSSTLGLAGLQPRYRFDKFVSGPCNALACIAAGEVLDAGRTTHNPMLIVGDTALGKTHLMQAIGHEMLSRNPKTRLLYITSDTFVGQLVQALRSGDSADMIRFKTFFRSLDVLLVDDVQFLAKKEVSQSEFFSTFNALLDRHGQVVLTADRHPQEIKGLQRRLKSRFASGIPVIVETPDKEMRLAILRQKAKEQNAVLPDDVADLLAERIRSNVRDLEGALHRVLTEARMHSGQITADLVSSSLLDLFSTQRQHLSAEDIQNGVADYYRIKRLDMLSPSRQRTLLRPRQVAMALTKHLTTLSLPEIGRAFNGRDHTTVIHACRRVDNLREQDDKVRDDWRMLLHELESQ